MNICDRRMLNINHTVVHKQCVCGHSAASHDAGVKSSGSSWNEGAAIELPSVASCHFESLPVNTAAATSRVGSVRHERRRIRRGFISFSRERRVTRRRPWWQAGWSSGGTSGREPRLRSAVARGACQSSERSTRLNRTMKLKHHTQEEAGYQLLRARLPVETKFTGFVFTSKFGPFSTESFVLVLLEALPLCLTPPPPRGFFLDFEDKQCV